MIAFNRHKLNKALTGPLVEQRIQMLDPIEWHLVDDQFRLMGLEPVEGFALVGIDYERAVLKLLHMAVEPVVDAVDIEVFRLLENSLQVVIGDKVALEFGSGLDSLLGVVLRDELLFVTEGYPRFLALEKGHLLRVVLMVLQTLLISSSVR